MAHVKVPEQTPKVSYTVTTAEDTFNINFVIFEIDGSDIDVFDVDVLLSPSTYTITPIPGTEGGFDGGTLVLDSSVSNTTIIIIRAIDLERITDFPTAGPFNINALNTDLDRMVAMVQQINQRAVNNAVHSADSVTDAPNLEFTEFAVDRAEKVIGFDGSGDIELKPGLTESVADAANSASEAAISASEASTSASEASTSASEASTSASEASTSASEASTSASEAAISASEAATSETNAAASTSVLEYTFDDSTSMEDPGSGDARLNNSTISSVTAIAFSNVTSGSGTPDVSDLLAAMDDVNNATGGAVITFRKSGSPGIFGTFYVTTVVDNTSWLQATVSYLAGVGTLTDADILMFSIAFSGEDGSGIASLKDDLSPQLAGFLDPDGHYIGFDKGADIASTSSLTVGIDGNYFDITGTSGIDDMIVAANRDFTCQFDGILTITVGSGITLNNAGGNFTTAPGDIIRFQSTAANTVVGVISKADGTPPVASGGAWTLINSIEADADASITITGLNATYAAYAIVLSSITASTNATLWLRLGDSGGIDTGASDYIYHSARVTQTAANYLANFSTADSKIVIGLASTGADGGLGAVLYLHRPEDNATDCFINGNYTSDGTGGTSLNAGGVFGRRVAPIDLDRVQILFNTGNVATGRFSIYGIDHLV